MHKVDINKVTVVPACESHSKDIWTWRNDPLTRENSRNTDLVPWESHKKWFANFLATKPSQMYICKDDNDHNLCMVRFDKLVDDVNLGDYEISVNLNPAYRGQRLSTTLVDLAISHFVKQMDEKVSGIVAEIKPSNVASIKCFGRANFKLMGAQHSVTQTGQNVRSRENECDKYYRKIL